MRYIFLPLVVLIMLVQSCSRKEQQSAGADDNWPTDSIRTLKTDLNFPWEILWGKDNFIWMTERGGKISKVDPKTGDIAFSTTLTDVVPNNEGGLLGMIQHPDFLKNGLFYVVYNYNSGGSYLEKLVQLKFTSNSIQTVATLIDKIPGGSAHDGSRLWITDEAVPKLFMTTGEAYVQDNAQLLTSLSGKVLRMNLDGSIPADNPISGSPIWSFGHRNPQGLVMANGILYESEHGPDIEDEVNIIEKNRNYGWPTVMGPCSTPGEIAFCTANNVKEPIWSSGGVTFAGSGLDYYNNPRIPGWQNCLLLAELKDACLRVLSLSTDGKAVNKVQVFFKNTYGRIRDICISPAGRVYLCTSNGGNTDVLVEISKP